MKHEHDIRELLLLLFLNINPLPKSFRVSLTASCLDPPLCWFPAGITDAVMTRCLICSAFFKEPLECVGNISVADSLLSV